ncbi:hypothetical protein TRIUR3_27110 [Triticum urartu]|uniref:Uncharacterized protein n=1 Tax=Triticum urartu TaxID=4572 RepID=M8ART0_TRIUA|nr:hypothetical protein TRIUR3_27110 [Triticum urartu]
MAPSRYAAAEDDEGEDQDPRSQSVVATMSTTASVSGRRMSTPSRIVTTRSFQCLFPSGALDGEGAEASARTQQR